MHIIFGQPTPLPFLSHRISLLRIGFMVQTNFFWIRMQNFWKKILPDFFPQNFFTVWQFFLNKISNRLWEIEGLGGHTGKLT